MLSSSKSLKKLNRLLSVATLTLLSLTLYAGSGTENSWPGFRGSRVDGHSSSRGVFTGKRDVGLKVAWQTPIGSAYSGIAVQGNLVITMFAQGDSDWIGAFHKDSGKKLWTYKIGPTYKGHDGSHDGPVGTPLIVGDQVFALGPFGHFFALEAKTGKQLWKQNLTTNFGLRVPFYGFGASPSFAEGHLILMVGGDDQAIVGFDPKTGEKKWASGSDAVTYQSSSLWEQDQQTLVVGAGEKKLTGVRPGSGEVVWSFAHEGNGARGASSLVPIPAGKDQIFLAYKDDASAMFRFTKKDGEWVGEKAWETRAIRNSYNVPLYYQGNLYAFSNRFLTCVDAASGESHWRSRPPGDGFLILVDGHLVVATKSGDLVLAKASPEGYQEVAKTKVFDKVAWSLPSFADGSFYVRGFQSLARVDITDATPATASASSEGSAVSAIAKLRSQLQKAPHKEKVVEKFLASQKSFPIVEDGWVHFVYQGEAEDMALGGDMFGARQEKPMHRLDGTNLYYFSLELEKDAVISYLFIKDYKEMLTDPLNPRQGKNYMVGKDMEMSFDGSGMTMSWFAMPKAETPAYLTHDKELPAARVKPHILQSKVMEKEINIEVVLPPGYESSKDVYPVAVVFDGNLAKSEGQWYRALNDPTANQIQPFVAVFLNEPSPFRSGKLGSMVADELLPFIDENYRISAQNSDRALIGMGVGGSAAISSALSNPGKVGKVATQSALLMDGLVGALTPNLGKIPAESRPEFYMDWSKYDLRNPQEAWDMGISNRKFAKTLKNQGFEVSAKEFNHGMGWTSWKTRTPPLLQALFPSGSK